MALDLAIFLFESIPYPCVQNLIGEKRREQGTSIIWSVPLQTVLPHARDERSAHGKGGTPSCQVSQLAMI